MSTHMNSRMNADKNGQASSASIRLNALSFQYGRAGLFSRRPAPRILHDIDLLV